jgi:hypothetical protein
LAQVSKQDVFACANPPRDCFTDRPSSDDNDDTFHGNILCYDLDDLLSVALIHFLPTSNASEDDRSRNASI